MAFTWSLYLLNVKNIYIYKVRGVTVKAMENLKGYRDTIQSERTQDKGFWRIKQMAKKKEGMGLRRTLAIPVSWGLDGREVDCVGDLEVVAQAFVEHELSTLEHHRKYICEGGKQSVSRQKWICLSSVI